MKTIIAVTVALLAFASPAIAEDAKTTVEKSTSATTDSMGNYYTMSEKTDFLVSKLMGARVYATMKDVDANTPTDKVGTDWDDIGEVNNIIISKEGKVQAVVLGVGGFLSIGEKDVAVKMSELRFVKKSGDGAEDFYIVVKSDKAALEKAPTWKTSAN